MAGSPQPPQVRPSDKLRTFFYQEPHPGTRYKPKYWKDATAGNIRFVNVNGACLGGGPAVLKLIAPGRRPDTSWSLISRRRPRSARKCRLPCSHAPTR
jgi:hypothetical protein